MTLDDLLKNCKTDKEISDKLEEISSIYNKGMIEGEKHRTSSPETKTNLELITTNMANIETHLGYIKETLDENKDQHKELYELIRNLPDKLDCKYANKSIEEDVKALKEGKAKSTAYWIDKAVSLISILLSGYIAYKLFI